MCETSSHWCSVVHLDILFCYSLIYINSSFTTGRTLKRQCPLNPKTNQTAFDESGSDEENIQVLEFEEVTMYINKCDGHTTLHDASRRGSAYCYWGHKHEDCWLSACVKFVINSVNLFACDTKRLLKNVFVKLCKKPCLVYY